MALSKFEVQAGRLKKRESRFLRKKNKRRKTLMAFFKYVCHQMPVTSEFSDFSAKKVVLAKSI